MVHTTWADFTLRMCNLGSRLQSARVSSEPSRKFLEDSGRSPEASASISSDRGVLRNSSRRRRDLSRAFSKAVDGVKDRKKAQTVKFSRRINVTQDKY